MTDSNGCARLNLASSTQIKAFTWSEKLVQLSSDKLAVMGFKSTKMAVVDVNDDHVMAEAECGGSHRSWAVHFDANQLRLS